MIINLDASDYKNKMTYHEFKKFSDSVLSAMSTDGSSLVKVDFNTDKVAIPVKRTVTFEIIELPF